jgi:hypothetical protein
MKYSISELKEIRKELAHKCIILEDALYITPDNEELRADLADIESEYEYVNSLIARIDPWESEWDKRFNQKYGAN